MNRYILFIALMVSVLLVMFPQSLYGHDGEDVTDQNDVDSVIIAMTRLDVNDTNLELSYKIKNNTDHDVWICDSVSVFTGPDFEVYLSEDKQSLLIRRRLDVPTDVALGVCPYGRYVLLRSGQERTESLLLAVPIEPRRLFVSGLATSDYARRLVLEIGFYNEDLPEMIRDILEMAEKLNCARLELRECSTAFFMRYFKGIWIAHWLFGGLSDFEEYTYKEGSEEIKIPYTWQEFNGEQVLRIEVDGVHIPYEEEEVSAADEPPQSETEPAGVTMALTGLYVNDTKIELDWKITNESDHEVWICESMSRDYPPPLFEQFLDDDAKTLVIRKLFDLSMSEGRELYPPMGSRYVRLRPGEEKVESVSVALPVRPYRMSSGNKVTNAEYAERLALEIGFYDEDLPALILEIVEIAEHINCDLSIGYHGFREDVSDRFFGGPIVALLFKGLLGFESNVKSADDDGEMWMPHLGEIRMGEKILRLMVDGVSIPLR